MANSYWDYFFKKYGKQLISEKVINAHFCKGLKRPRLVSYGTMLCSLCRNKNVDVIGTKEYIDYLIKRGNDGH